MLSEQMNQLLTAFVDGELDQVQRVAVTRLLNESSEAREMLRQLQGNAHRIKNLPHRKVEPSLVDEIMQAIEERKAQVKPATHSSRRRLMPYVAASLAASLLVAVFGVVYWTTMHTGQGGIKNDGQHVVQNPVVPDKPPEPTPQPEPTPITPKKPNPLLAAITEAVVRDFGALPAPEKVFTASFRELQKDKAIGQLKYELNREKAVQFNVTVKNNDLAMTRLKEVLKDRGIKLVTDPAAGKSLKEKNQAKIEYLVFAENLTADEVSKIMSDLSKTFVVGLNNTQKNVESPYHKVTVTPIAKDEKQKVAKLLGVAPAALEPKEGKQEPKRDRQVVLLPTTAGGAPSAEVRQFVNQRRGTQPGTIQLLIKIRQE